MGDEKILIDKMFTGRYIDDWNNIGHEIIYYFKPIFNIKIHFLY